MTLLLNFLAKNLKSFIYLWLIENYAYDFNSKL